MFPFCRSSKCHVFIIFISSILWIINAEAVESGKSVIDPVGTLGKLTIALIIVLAVFWLFSRLMKQMQGAQNIQNSSLSIVGVLPLGQKEKVIIVQAGDQQILLGVTTTQINTLHVLTSPIANDVSLSNVSEFKDKLSAAIKSQIVKK